MLLLPLNSNRILATPDIQISSSAEIKCSSRFDRICDYLAVGQRGVVALLSRKALDIERDDALVSDNDAVTESLVGAQRLLSLDENGRNMLGEIWSFLELEEGCIAEVDHSFPYSLMVDGLTKNGCILQSMSCHSQGKSG